MQRRGRLEEESPRMHGFVDSCSSLVINPDPVGAPIAPGELTSRVLWPLAVAARDYGTVFKVKVGAVCSAGADKEMKN
jgi:hypothetical protein